MIFSVSLWDMIMFPFRITYAAIVFTVVAISGLVRGVKWGVKVGQELKGHLTTELKCPVGHVQPADGVWQCSCGFKRAGFAWKECPGCHTRFAHVDCKECGLSIANPAA